MPGRSKINDPSKQELHAQILRHCVPSSLSVESAQFIGSVLTVRCCPGWGWSCGGDVFDVDSLQYSELEVVPESFVEFLEPRGAITGFVQKRPVGYHFHRFLAIIMSDGLDFNFTDKIAPAWKIMLGNGEVDSEQDWFPVLSGEETIYGCGAIGLNSEWLDKKVPRLSSG